MRMIAVAGLVMLALRGLAPAADDCLTGPSTLGDQRALATLRADTETVCPCDAFGLDRGAYRACARQLVNGALLAATLRAECKKTAIRDYKGATCATTKVACGRWKATSKEPLGCKVKAAAACHDRAGAIERGCTEQTHCRDVVDWTAATCSDVRAPGPFAAGARVITFTKPSAVDPMQPRVLSTVVWYPAAAGAGPVDPTYDAVLDAPLAPGGGPFPLVMFSHGSCGYPLQSTFLWPLVASRGFIVVAPPHPGNTLLELATCGSATALVNAAIERPADIEYVLDQMLAANQNALSPFFGAVDPARLGMSGHSFGGWTTFRVIAQDPRFVVAVPLAAAVPAGAVVTIPSLMMLSQLDTFVSNPAIRSAFAGASSPKYLVEIENAGHFAYSNGCFPSPDCNPPVTLTQDEAHAVVLRWVVPFLERHLRGDGGFTPFLVPPAGPGVVLSAAP